MRDQTSRVETLWGVDHPLALDDKNAQWHRGARLHPVTKDSGVYRPGSLFDAAIAAAIDRAAEVANFRLPLHCGEAKRDPSVVADRFRRGLGVVVFGSLTAEGFDHRAQYPRAMAYVLGPREGGGVLVESVDLQGLSRGVEIGEDPETRLMSRAEELAALVASGLREPLSLASFEQATVPY